jgi:HD-GYP domain-containing protein (c-di-GMP phosphodiesterase class II)
MRKLIPFAEKYNINDYDFQPIPTDIYNHRGAIQAHRGQKLYKERLKNSFIFDDVYEDNDYSPTVAEKHPELTDDYEEEAASKIADGLDNLYFVPFLKIKLALRTNIYQIKEIFKKIIVNNVVFLDSKNNAKISRYIASSLDNILDSNLFASEYIDMITAIRNKDNYLTFSHSCAVAFYTMGIAKKLKMLKEDLYTDINLGRWIPIKTEKYEKGTVPVNFSNQLLKYIDNQKNSIQLRYNSPVKEKLYENLYNLMHDYTEIDRGKKYPSLTIDFDILNMHILTMAALNHDIGKLCISNSILNKPDKLTHEEFMIMAKHPNFSVRKLKEVEVNIPDMFSYILGHHRLSSERGYPPLKHVPPECKIIAIADIYDAMRAPTYYGKQHSQQETLEHIRDLYEEGCFDLPLYLTAVHTFEEFNHEHVTHRVKKVIEV